MIKILFFLVYASGLFAVTITNQEIYENNNSIDIMFSFDAPYKGKIIQKQDAKNKIFILEHTTIEKKTTRQIHSNILQKLQLIPYHDKIFIELFGENSFQVEASKTIDNYGVRLRITPTPTEETLSTYVIPKKEEPIQTKKEDNISAAYLKVMGLLLALIAFLYLLKKWLENRGDTLKGGWLFESKKSTQNSSIKVKHQRAIDVKNRVALIAYGDKEYLLLLGNNNLLLDTFTPTKKQEQNSFDDVLADNEEALEHYIKQNATKLQEYKQKISTKY